MQQKRTAQVDHREGANNLGQIRRAAMQETSKNKNGFSWLFHAFHDFSIPVRSYG